MLLVNDCLQHMAMDSPIALSGHDIDTREQNCISEQPGTEILSEQNDFFGIAADAAWITCK